MQRDTGRQEMRSRLNISIVWLIIVFLGFQDSNRLRNAETISPPSKYSSSWQGRKVAQRFGKLSGFGLFHLFQDRQSLQVGALGVGVTGLHLANPCQLVE